MFKFRSVRSIVNPPARTGIDRRRRTAVNFTLHTNKGTRSSRKPLYRIFITVVMKLIDARIEETPERWRAKMARSIHGPAWAILDARGG